MPSTPTNGNRKGSGGGAETLEAMPTPVPRRRAQSDVRQSYRPGGGEVLLDDLVEGDVLDGKYRLVCPLGEGGMGSVWLAHNEALDIEVAIKVLRTEVRGMKGAKLAERLMQEARATAKLGHPAIVKINDVGQTNMGDPYVVMELLEGEDLATTLEHRGTLHPIKAVRSLLPIAHALVSAHDKQIVHRDIKPENIFFAQLENGAVQPKLIDFGVAKLDTHRDERLTAVGAIMGSPGYMPPEQARGLEVDERADIWSLCVVLFETITGRLPFSGANYHALLRAIIEDEVRSLASFGIDDEELWQVLQRGLTKDPAERWQSMRELGIALADWLLLRGVTEDICGASLVSTWMRERRLGDDALDTYPPPHEARAGLDHDVEDTSDGPAVDLSDVEWTKVPVSSAETPSPSSDPDLSGRLNILVEPTVARPERRGWRTTLRALALVAIVVGLFAIWRQGVLQPHVEGYLERYNVRDMLGRADEPEATAGETAAGAQPLDESPAAGAEGEPSGGPSVEAEGEPAPEVESQPSAQSDSPSDSPSASAPSGSASAQASGSDGGSAPPSAGQKSPAPAPRRAAPPPPKLKKPTF